MHFDIWPEKIRCETLADFRVAFTMHAAIVLLAA